METESFTPPPDMRHNPYYSFGFFQPLSAFILAIKRLPSHIASIPVYIHPTIIRSISK